MGQYLPFKRVFFDRIFHRSYWTWRKHPTIIVPTMLGSALTSIEESALTMAVIIYLTSLASRNLLTGFLNEVSQSGYLGVLRDPAFSLEVILVITTALAVLFLVGILGGGFVASAEYGTYLEAWTKGSVSIGSMVDNGRRNWKRMAWTLLLTDLVTWGPAVIGLVLVLVSAQNANTPSGIGLFVFYSLIAGLLFLVSALFAFFTVYSLPIAIIDQTSGLGAIRRSLSFSLHNFGITLIYVIVRLVFQFLSFFLVLAAAIVGLPLSSLGTVLLSLLLTPILHSTKTMIYSYGRPAEPEMPFEVAGPIWQDIGTRLPRAAWTKVKLGLAEIPRFTFSVRNLPFHLLSILAFFLGIALGDYVSMNGLVGFLGIRPGIINPAVTQSFGPALGVDIFLNNWLVSIATGLAGIAFGIPTFQTILFNGFILGAILPAFQNLTLFLAGILPHGIIEIPSFVLSGSVGLKLGYAALRTRLEPGPESREFLSTTLRQAVYIVVGLAPLFLIAGLIEGNLTPIIMRFFGWTG